MQIHSTLQNVLAKYAFNSKSLIFYAANGRWTFEMRGFAPDIGVLFPDCRPFPLRFGAIAFSAPVFVEPRDENLLLRFVRDIQSKQAIRVKSNMSV